MYTANTDGTLAYFSKDSEFIKAVWKNFPVNNMSCNYYYVCFSPYFGIFKSDCNFYFAFPSVPVWYMDVINDFNSKFNNIKYKVIDDKIVYINDSRRYASLEKDGYLKINIEARCPLFTIEFSDKYSDISRKGLGYFVHHMLRMINIGENYTNIDEVLNGYGDISPLEFIIKANNRQKGYRSLAEINLTIDHLMSLDDIDKVNSIYFSNSQRQTEIIRNINRNTDNSNFKIGEKIKIKIGYSIADATIVHYYKDDSSVYVKLSTRDVPSLVSTRNIIPENLQQIKKGKFKTGDIVAIKRSVRWAVDTYVDFGVVKNVYEKGWVDIVGINRHYRYRLQEYDCQTKELNLVCEYDYKRVYNPIFERLDAVTKKYINDIRENILNTEKKEI